MIDLFGNDLTIPAIKKRKPSAKKQNAKNNVLPHTQAKLDLYYKYLKEYLSVLMQAKGIANINLYDIYCGNGRYDDGKPGSPVIALDCIKQVQADFISSGKPLKPVRLTVNDGQKKRYDNVKGILEKQNDNACILACHNLEAEAMFQRVKENVCQSAKNERNLIFIDPYGYREIHKLTIKQLLDSKNTEIYLFLPIAQMHRFSPTALKRVNNPSYDPLRRFISEFLPDYDFSQRPTPDKVFSFINSITAALRFDDQYYSCSHYIQRDGAGNYYGIFFITNHIYGLDKMLNAKWAMDKENGEGFRLSSKSTNQQSIFDFFELKKNDEFTRHERFLRKEILDFLAQGRPVGNRELYPFLLNLGYLSKHTTPILKKMYTEKIIQYSCFTNSKSPAFYLNYGDYQLPDDKCIIQLTSVCNGSVKH